MSITVTLDSTGRLKLPEAMRRKLALKGGAKMTAALTGDCIQLTPESPVRLVKKGKRLVIAGFPRGYSAAAAVVAAREERSEQLAVRNRKR